jgi:hypothetical protein
MTPDERQALRAKHHVGQNEADDQCQACFTIPYPCDVIRLLDATEELKSSDLKTKVECDHPEGVLIPDTTEGINVWQWFTYCPVCGEKL